MTRAGEVRVCGAGEVFASRDVVLLAARLFKSYRDSLRDGGRNDPDVERWTDALLEAARRTLDTARCSDIGTSEVPTQVESESAAMLDPVDTREAARLLGGCTERNVVGLVRRNAFTSARMVAGRYLIERGEVLARAERTTR